MEGLEKTASQPPQWLLVSILHRVPCLFSLLYSEPLTHTAPSAAPSNVRATSTSSSITVQWEMVPCIHRNGEIIGYSVRYGVQGQSIQTIPVSGGDTTMTISSVMSSTNYSIEVAAVTRAGTGPYSDPITVETFQSKLRFRNKPVSTKSMTVCIWIFNEPLPPHSK